MIKIIEIVIEDSGGLEIDTEGNLIASDSFFSKKVTIPIKKICTLEEYTNEQNEIEKDKSTVCLDNGMEITINIPYERLFNYVAFQELSLLERISLFFKNLFRFNYV